MCGRYTLTSPLEGVRQVFDFVERPNLAPRFNIAPTQEVAAVRLGDDGARHFVALRWGLIPAWAKDAAIASRLINARGETVAEKPSFRSAFAQRRCLIIADGFYEWKTENKKKQPYRIVMADRRPFAFAGLWENWRDPASGDSVETCCIVTTDANTTLAPIHHRMPVILDPGDFSAWLDCAGPAAAAQALLKPYPGKMTAFRVSPRVNKVANDDAALLEPFEPEAPPPPAQGQLL